MRVYQLSILELGRKVGWPHGRLEVAQPARYVAVSQCKLKLSLPILVNHNRSGWLAWLGLLAWFLARANPLQLISPVKSCKLDPLISCQSLFLQAVTAMALRDPEILLLKMERRRERLRIGYVQ
jgi:hypothetical protein